MGANAARGAAGQSASCGGPSTRPTSARTVFCGCCGPFVWPTASRAARCNNQSAGGVTGGGREEDDKDEGDEDGKDNNDNEARVRGRRTRRQTARWTNADGQTTPTAFAVAKISIKTEHQLMHSSKRRRTSSIIMN